MYSHPTPDHDVVVVGSGFAGLGMAIRLQQEGRTDFVVLEQSGSVGGTWRDNDYPGCACDVPSHLYSFSFAQNPNWSRTFSPQAEIRDYIERTTDQFGIRPKIRFNSRMSAAEWDEAAQLWRLSINDGADTVTCRVLIGGLGPLNRPSYAKVPGREDFAGTQFHSMHWDHDHDLTGKRVAVIGTGASAIQFIPEVAKHAASVDVFQRTAPWVLPKPDRPVRPRVRTLFRHVPGLLHAYRTWIYARLEARVVTFDHPRLSVFGERLAKSYAARKIKDPVLLEKVIPDYRMGCKRVLLSNHYLRALAKDHVDVVTTPIDAITAGGIRTADGVEHQYDTIIHGTGFKVTEPYTEISITGRDGVELAEKWSRGGTQAHKGSAVDGFPNLFLLVGPNTGLGHNSIIYMIEAQVNYVLDALRQMDARKVAAVSVKPEALRAYNEEIQQRLATTVWQDGGCSSYYQDKHGVNRAIWPGHTYAFRRVVREFDLTNYEMIPAAVPAPEPAAV